LAIFVIYQSYIVNATRFSPLKGDVMTRYCMMEHTNTIEYNPFLSTGWNNM